MSTSWQLLFYFISLQPAIFDPEINFVFLYFPFLFLIALLKNLKIKAGYSLYMWSYTTACAVVNQLFGTLFQKT